MTSSWIKRTWKIFGGVLVLGGMVGFLPRACYRLNHWPRNVDYPALVAFADAQWAISAGKEGGSQVPKGHWPAAIQGLRPKRVELSRGDRPCMDIVLHDGGALRGATGFRIVAPGDGPPKGERGDVVLPTANARVYRFDFYY